MQETKSLQQWLALAASQQSEDREVAARALRAYVHDHSGTTALIKLLGDTDWRVRRAAVETFLQAQQLHTVPMVLEALYEEENAGKRNAALDILSRFGKGIIPYLEPHISAEQSDVVMFLIQILGDLRDTTYLPFINQALENENPNVVSAAILALGKIGRPDSVSPLLRFLEGPDLWLKTQAIEALGEMQEPETIPNLIAHHSIPYCRKAILNALAKIHAPMSYGALVEFLVHDGKLNPDALEALVRLYHAPQPSRLKTEEQKAIREYCRKNLKPGYIGTLLESYRECSDAEKKNILEVLGWAAAEPAISLFVSELQNDWLIEAAAKGLIYCDETALSAIVHRLEQSNSNKEIVTLLSVLWELSSVVDVKHIEKFLQCDVLEIRQAAHKLLARMPASGALPFWIRSVSDGDPSVSESCREPLLSLCKRDANSRAQIQTELR
ncbi:MAG TPA: HEAT repeat domain-containing protein, partial [Acidobacteriota bacterium]|nr:HEAT repeat domain-containing protein [Acidobacteriota bacterium]